MGHLIYLKPQDSAYWKYLLQAITIDNYGLSAVTDNWHSQIHQGAPINTSHSISPELMLLVGTWKTSNMWDDSMFQANGY